MGWLALRQSMPVGLSDKQQAEYIAQTHIKTLERRGFRRRVMRQVLKELLKEENPLIRAWVKREREKGTVKDGRGGLL